MEIEVKKIKDLKPNPLNPRKSSVTQDENLKKSLEKFGVVEPIVFNKRSGYIVGGHFRVRELKKLGYKEVECVIVDLSPDDEKELLIRLNANTGDWDTDLLLQDWINEPLKEWGCETNWQGVENNNMNEDDIDISENFDPVGTSNGLQRVVFIFDGPDEAESYLKSQKVKFEKRNMAWQVNMSTRSI